MSLPEPFEISRLIFLKKQKAELVFKKEYINWKGTNSPVSSNIQSELLLVEKELEMIEKKLNGFELVFPNQSEINSINSMLGKTRKEDIYSALSLKSGETYELLKRKSVIMKDVYENTTDVAKLNIILSQLKGKEKSSVLKAVSDKGHFREEQICLIKDEAAKKELFKLCARLGYNVSEKNIPVLEEKTLVGAKPVWVPKTKIEQVAQLNKNLSELSRKIQFFNAKRQIKVFTQQEENDFALAQKDYLNLLKEQDSILENYS